MKKRLLITFLALSMTAVPLSVAGAKTTTTTTIDESSESDDDDDSDSGLDDVDDEFSGEFTKYDIRTTPAKKTVKVGKTFYINVIPEDNTEWEDIPDEEWEEICQENIDSISFRSSNSIIASVNKINGKVKAKKKGTAVIKTTVALANGESAVYKSKIYVTK